MVSLRCLNCILFAVGVLRSTSVTCLLLVYQEIDVQNKKAIVIFVPVPQLRAYQKIQTRLVRELEKKFSGKHVVFIAQVYICPVLPECI